ncbi:hypothetical protein EXW72_01145 [Pseudomonas sp. BCA14]|uniref:hypothetical protein n=1 Tax=unclassified Pseudomonas TaxID=196821 RepID=UPI00106DFC8C|nr:MULTISPECIES: hypothetical protein [unclassified Pseudomonas]TFF13432.1 hypothetical protein EXW70_02545 [Pseudomonas sp. JMN1]TFF15884.1 hypothetical protein EXW71_06495 [Pseudomonas sp. BCA17]TFF29820.1 hypothetical protein EXW73_05730 [Pseudomonas sp. BCA13]TFF30662.1 hypothetical protein EXW72_01145 [Pseudomonas sp. BCA14]
MSPMRPNDVNISYTYQLVLCVVLIVCVSLSMGIYITRLNAHIDKHRDLSPVYLYECHKGRGGFIVYADGRRSSDNCYDDDEGESAGADEAQGLPGSHRAGWLKYILPTVEEPRILQR